MNVLIGGTGFLGGAVAEDMVSRCQLTSQPYHLVSNRLERFWFMVDELIILG